jgi:hypothetical protein
MREVLLGKGGGAKFVVNTLPLDWTQCWKTQSLKLLCVRLYAAKKNFMNSTAGQWTTFICWLDPIEKEDYARSNLIHEIQLEADMVEVTAGQDHSIIRYLRLSLFLGFHGTSFLLTWKPITRQLAPFLSLILFTFSFLFPTCHSIHIPALIP